MLGNLTAIAGIYPTHRLPYRGTFIRDQFTRLADHAETMQVIAPLRVFSREGLAVRDRALPISKVDNASPFYWPFGNLAQLSLWSFQRAVERTIRSRPTVRGGCYYGHFLYPAGICAVRAAQEWGGDAFVALGESSLEKYIAWLGQSFVTDALAKAVGIVCVSEKNASICYRDFAVSREKVLVIPNGIDGERFIPRSKAEARSRLKLPQDRPIGIFVGHLIPRKGVDIAIAAMKKFPQAGLVLLGAGVVPTDAGNIVHAGPVEHSEVSWWLSAADVFLFPTEAEGCPNALLEAAACGVPIVASDIPEIRELSFIQNMHLAKVGDPDAFSSALRHFLDKPPRHIPRAPVTGILTVKERMKRVAQWMALRSGSHSNRSGIKP